MQALVKALWDGYTEFDAELDVLRPANRTPPRPLGIRPPPIDPATLPTFKPDPSQIGPQPVVSPKPQAKTKRAGWLGGWL
jgi:hypothetical protein